MKYSLSKFEKMGVVAMALIAGGFFYFTKIYDPEVKRFEKAKSKLEKAKKDVAGMGNTPNSTLLQKAVKEQIEKIQAMREHTKSLSRKSQNKAEAQQIIAQITQMAEEKALTVASQTFLGAQPASIINNTSATSDPINKPNTDKDKFQWYQYELVLRGPYQGLTRLIGSLREAEWVVALDNLQVRSSGTSDSVEIKIKILL